MVDLYVDLPLELTAACVTGLLEAAFASLFAAAVLFVVTVVLSELEDGDNGAVLFCVVRGYHVVFVLFAR